MAVLRISSDVLSAASRRLGIRVDTLDAIHLATAERYRRTHVAEAAPMFATHDRTLAAAARHVGFEVIGSPLESSAWSPWPSPSAILPASARSASSRRYETSASPPWSSAGAASPTRR